MAATPAPPSVPLQPPKPAHNLAHFLYSGHSVSTISLSPIGSGTYSCVSPCANLQGAEWGGVHVSKAQLQAPTHTSRPTRWHAPAQPPLAAVVLRVPAAAFQ